MPKRPECKILNHATFGLGFELGRRAIDSGPVCDAVFLDGRIRTVLLEARYWTSPNGHRPEMTKEMRKAVIAWKKAAEPGRKPIADGPPIHFPDSPDGAEEPAQSIEVEVEEAD